MSHSRVKREPCPTAALPNGLNSRVAQIRNPALKTADDSMKVSDASHVAFLHVGNCFLVQLMYLLNCEPNGVDLTEDRDQLELVCLVVKERSLDLIISGQIFKLSSDDSISNTDGQRSHHGPIGLVKKKDSSVQED